MVSALDPRRLRAIEELVPSQTTPDQKKQPEPSSTVDRSNDDLVRAFVASTRTEGRAAPSPVYNDRILYAGMTSSANDEVAALRSSGASVTRLESMPIEEAVAFAHSLGLNDAQAENVAKVLAHAKPENRDELGALAKAWAPAEKGGVAPSRLVLSGHSEGDGVYRNKGGPQLLFADVRELAAVMPRAASFVRDLHLSGCNTALNATTPELRAAWLRAFPGLQTTWGYQGSCPLGPAPDLRAWEERTRGDATAIALDAQLLYNGVTIADRAGHTDGKGVREPVAQIRKEVANAELVLPGLLEGNWPEYEHDPDNRYVPNGLYQTYQTFQLAAAREDLSPAERAAYRGKAQQLLRLRYYDGVKSGFQATYGTALAFAFARARMIAPDFEKMSRPEALAAARGFIATTGDNGSPEVRAARQLLRAFIELDPTVIPKEWCSHQ